MYAWHPPRARSGALSLAMVGLMGLVLARGLGVSYGVERTVSLVSVDFAVPRPPPPPRVPPRSGEAAKDEAGTRNIRNRATAIVSPPVVPLIVPPAVIAAAVAGVGAAANTGAADVPGPGQGAGAFGNGSGGGGDGGGGDAVVGPRQIRGKLSYRDLPEGVLPEGAEAQLEVLYTVEADGSVGSCRVERASGYPAIDALACRLIQQRFRFRPALDARDRPVRARMIQSHTWVARAD